MVDYLIVGLGLAGISFCEQLEKNDKSFQVVNDASQTSSMVSGGLYNPVILKRFTLAWNAKEQLSVAMPFYDNLEKKLNVKLNHKVPVLRRFASVEEQNLWYEASDKKGLNEFLSPEIQQHDNSYIEAPFGYGKVLYTGRIAMKPLLQGYEAYLSKKNAIIRETFDYNVLKIDTSYIQYKSIKAKHLIFAEGFGVKNNPYFNYLPLNGTKGEYIIIKAPDLKEVNSIKSSIFCIPLGNDLYKIGANYERHDKTNAPTDKAKVEILRKLDDLINCDYEITEHIAGVRPTVVDRRPLTGRHPEYDNLYIINGFGSRGVMIAPFVSEKLFNFIEKQESLTPDIDISRFDKK